MSLLHYKNESTAGRRRMTFAGLAVATVSMIALSGCAAPAPSGDTTLSFFSWDNEALMQPVIDAFEAENPTIKIDFSTAPPVAEYVSTLQTRLLSGTAADVFVMAAENKTNLIDGGYVLDLTDEPFMDDLAKFNKTAYAADGKDYAASISSWAGAYIYNVDLLAQVGVTTPPTSWSDFLDVLQKLKDAGITPILDSATQIPLSVAALVGEQNAADGGNVDADIFSGKASFADLWTKPLTAWNEQITDGMMTPDVVGLAGDQIIDEFVNGRVAIIGGAPWNLGDIRTKGPDINFSFMAVPGINGSGVWAGAASPGWAINSKTEHTEAAKAFIAFLTSAKGVELYQKATNAITTTSNFTPVLDEALAPILAGLLDGSFYLPQIAWPKYQDILNTEAVAQLQLMIQGEISPADVGAALDKKLAEQ